MENRLSSSTPAGKRWLLAVAVCVSLAASYLPAPALAEEASALPAAGDIIVTSFDDAADPNPADGNCTSTSGCTLRAAVQTANANPDQNRIILPRGTYTLDGPAGDDTAASGDLDITADLTLIGQDGPAVTFIDGGGIDRVFNIVPSSTIHVTIQGVTIQNGSPANDIDADAGGGIEYEPLGYGGSLTIVNSIIQNNTAVEGGGGLDVYGENANASVTIQQSIIRNNETAGANGGGILSVKTPIEIRDSTIHNNSAKAPSTASASGGGLYLNLANATLVRSTFSANHAKTDGGAIYTTSSVVSAENSTFSGNSAGDEGGAIFFNSIGKNLTLTNVTMTDNCVTSSFNVSCTNSTPAGTAGGLYEGANTGIAIVRNTIIAGNKAASSADLSGTPGAGSSDNLIGGDAKLSPLGNYGGPTQTHLPLAGSPALDAGNDAYAPETDQRGQVRVLDSTEDADTVDRVDIGACEAHPTMVDIPDQTLTGSPVTVTFTVADGDWPMTVSGTSSDQTVVSNGNITGSAVGNSVTLTIVPTRSGTTTLTATVSDPVYGGSMSDTFVLTVTANASPPDVTPASTPEDTPSTSGLVIVPNAADTSVTYFLIDSITNGRLFKNDGTTELADGTYITSLEGAAGLKFTPAANFNGTGSFAVHAAYSDTGAGLSAPTTAFILVTAVNDPPTGEADTLSAVREDSGQISIPFATLLANDSPGPPDESSQALSITGGTAGAGGAVAISGENVLYTPAADFSGTASFTYTLLDSDGATSLVTVNIPVTPVADTPSITGATTAEDTRSTAGLVISRNDVDGNEVTHFQIADITRGTLYKNDGVTELTVGSYITFAEGNAGLKFSPIRDLHSATHTFSVIVKAATDSSGSGISSGAAATIAVTEVNDAPTGVDDSLTARAEDSGPWTIPFADLTGNDSSGPVDESGQALTISAVSSPMGGTVSISGTAVIFTPDPDHQGPASFTYTLEDDGTTNGAADPKSNTAAASFTITEVNDASTGIDDTLADVAEDSGPRTIPFATLLGNDSAGPANESSQTITVTGVGSAAGGSVAISGTDVIFTPALDFHGTAVFTYTLQDDGTTAGTADPTSQTASVSFTVTPVNDAPVAQEKVMSVVVGRTSSGTVAATDVDGDTLAYAVVDAPARGTVTMTGTGSFTYRSTAIGADTFTFKATDGTADSNVATVTITIHSEPSVPGPGPVLTMTVPVTETRESSIVVSGTADPVHDVVVNGTRVRTDGQGNWSTIVPLEEGPNGITATDGFTIRSVTVVRDTIPPGIELTASATRTEEETVVLTVTSEENARIEIAGQQASTLTVELKMGNNRFTATATDRVGNQSAATITVLRVGKVPKPVVVAIAKGQSGEAAIQSFKVYLPGEAAIRPMLLRIVSPSTESAGTRLAESAAMVAITGDAEGSAQVDGSPIRDLPVKATVTFTYDPATVSNPADLKIYYYDPKWKVWVDLGGMVDTAAHTVTVQVDHFTAFAAMEPRQEAPVLHALPAVAAAETLTVTGTGTPDTPVSLVINGQAQTTVLTDGAGRFTMEGRLTEGRNRVYVKGTGVLASREMTVTYPSVNYTDIGSHWAEAAIRRLAKLGIASIYPEPLFQPEERVTRLEFAVMVARALQLPPADEVLVFTDTDALPARARPEVAAAVWAGIIKGMPDGSFAPNALVTRAEMAVMLSRALKYAGKETTPGDKVFTDGDQIPGWAKEQVLIAARYGLITGYTDGSFQSGNTTTRAEAVTMLNRLLNVLSDQ